MGHQTLYQWLAYFVGGAPSHEVQQAAIALGLAPAWLYSPMACEVCGAMTYLPNGPHKAESKVVLESGETLHLAVWEAGPIMLRVSTPLQAGDAMWLGRGKGGECNC